MFMVKKNTNYLCALVALFSSLAIYGVLASPPEYYDINTASELSNSTTLYGFEAEEIAGVEISIGDGLEARLSRSEHSGAPYVAEGDYSMVLSWQAAGTYELSIDYIRDLIPFANEHRLQLDCYIFNEGVIPQQLSLSHDRLGEFSNITGLKSNCWNTLTFRTETVSDEVANGKFTIRFTADAAGSLALDNFRNTSLRPKIYQASGHEKRCDLRWSNAQTTGFSRYNVYRASVGSDDFELIENNYVTAIIPAISDHVGENGVSYVYRVGALINGIEYLSDDWTVTSRAETDDEFLEAVQVATSGSYWINSNPRSGLSNNYQMSSVNIGASGFTLASLPVMVEREYITREAAARRVLTGVRFLSYQAERYQGFFAHILDSNTGQRIGGNYDVSENSFLVQGLLTVSSYFNGSSAEEVEIRQLADQIYRDIDWYWALRAEETDARRLWWGYNETDGWNITIGGYHESSGSYLHAIASPTHPIPAERWHDGWGSYRNGAKIYGHRHWFSSLERALFYDYMTLLTLDPNFSDNNGNYFNNARNVTLAHREYHIENPFGFPNYGENEWGQNAVVLNNTYFHNRPWTNDVGNISPYGVLGMLPYAPEVCLPAIRHMYDQHSEKIYNSLGFTFGYNIQEGWYNMNVSSIDAYMLTGVIENYRTGLIWQLYMNNRSIHDAMERIGMSQHAEAGLKLKLYHDPGSWTNEFPDLDSLVPIDEEVVPIPSKRWRNQEEDFCQRYEGHLMIHTGGVYTLSLDLKRAAVLSINGEVVIDESSFHASLRTVTVELDLPAGSHEFQLDYFNKYHWGSSELKLHYQGPDSADEMQRIPVTAFRQPSWQNSAPQWNGANVSMARVGESFSVELLATDADGDKMTISSHDLPSWLELIDRGDGQCELIGTASADDVGDLQIDLLADDGSEQSSKSFSLQILPLVDRDPAIIQLAEASPGTVFEGETTSLSALAVDPDGDAISYHWEMVSGVGEVHFPNGSEGAEVLASFSKQGDYVMEMSASSNGKTVRTRCVVEVIDHDVDLYYDFNGSQPGFGIDETNLFEVSLLEDTWTTDINGLTGHVKPGNYDHLYFVLEGSGSNTFNFNNYGQIKLSGITTDRKEGSNASIGRLQKTSGGEESILWSEGASFTCNIETGLWWNLTTIGDFDKLGPAALTLGDSHVKINGRVSVREGDLKVRSVTTVGETSHVFLYGTNLLLWDRIDDNGPVVLSIGTIGGSGSVAAYGDTDMDLSQLTFTTTGFDFRNSYAGDVLLLDGTFSSQLTAGSHSYFELEKTMGETSADQVKTIAGLPEIQLAGAMTASLLAGSDSLQAGDRFTLFSGELSGGFSQMNLPPLISWLAWNRDDFSSSGVLAVDWTEASDPYREWSDEHGLELGPDGDDDGSGVSNLAEYLFGGDPNNPHDNGKMQQVDVVDGVIEFTFFERINDPSVRYSFSQSSTLELDSWSEIKELSRSTGEIDGDFQEVTYRFAMDANESRLFIRVVAEIF